MCRLALDTRIAEETGALSLFDPVCGDQGDWDAGAGCPRDEDLSGFRLRGSDDLIGGAPGLFDGGQDLLDEIIITCTVSSSENS
jgi:hypothetical protein